MFGIESKEMLFILLAVLILFGPRRIPEVARALGKGMGDIRDALSGVEREIRDGADPSATAQVRATPPAGALPAANIPAPPRKDPGGAVAAAAGDQIVSPPATSPVTGPGAETGRVLEPGQARTMPEGEAGLDSKLAG